MTHPQTNHPMVEAISQVLLGKTDTVSLAVCAFLSEGHLLIEDVPGVGKTTLAQALAQAVGGTFRRIQFTADMLPADITGVSIWHPSAQQFEHHPGPIFANIVLADEINRAPPRTQSALLEAMSETQVSVAGTPRPLPRPFMVVATQNAAEHYGTYPLPESLMDRFAMRLSIGYPPEEAERRFVGRPAGQDPAAALPQVLTADALDAIRAQIDAVRLDDAVLDYLLRLVTHTRTSADLRIGISPRGAMSLHRAVRAWAFLQGRDYALIDDIKHLAVPVLAHRVATADNRAQGADTQAGIRAIRAILATLEVPL
ncbi:MAG: MoxR family ATPase [Myxococcales bacterium]|nr:MoxR family ATPase [Myxococcales bacterium]